MWKCRITIDKTYEKEKCVLIRKLRQYKGIYISESETSGNYIVDISVHEKDSASAKEFICDCIAKIILIYFKLNYIRKRLLQGKITPEYACVFAVMIYYDNESEYNSLYNTISTYDCFSIDGIYNFAIKPIKEQWEDLCRVSEGLFSGEFTSDELADVCKFVMEEKIERSKLLLADAACPVITDIANGAIVIPDDLYDDPMLNTLSCIVASGAKEITVDSTFDGREELALFKKFAKVKSI